MKLKLPIYKHVLKDSNFIELNQNLSEIYKRIFHIKTKDQQHLQTILQQDSEFLCNHNLMDYSLYLVVEKAPKEMMFGQAPLGMSRNFFRSEDGKHIYHLGVIDYLQQWNGQKRGEHWLKTRLLCMNRSQLSAVEPLTYQERWIDFINSQLLNSYNEDDIIQYQNISDLSFEQSRRGLTDDGDQSFTDIDLNSLQQKN